MNPDDRRPAVPHPDLYRDWDAAYVLGSLSPAERLEYEEHLARCPECAAALAELAGMPSLLASIDADEAFALEARSLEPAALEPGVALHALAPVDAPPTILPLLLSRARASRRRSRLVAAAVGVSSVAAAVALTLVVALAVWPAGGSSGPGVLASSAAASPATSAPNDATLASQVQFVPQVPGPLSAEASLQDEPWGTRIEWKCSWASTGTGQASGYAEPPPPPSGATGAAGAGSVGYGMIVTDRAGASVQVATWTSGPGTVATPTATTSIRLADIASVAIVASDSGEVLLKSNL